MHNFMVNKRSGQVEYAVMSFGGFLGMGESYHPLPWKSLTYDTRQGGYVVDIDKNKLQAAPSYKAGEEPTYDRAYVSGCMSIMTCRLAEFNRPQSQTNPEKRSAALDVRKPTMESIVAHRREADETAGHRVGPAPRVRCGSIEQPSTYLAVLLSSELDLLLAGVRGCMLEGRLRSRHARSRLE